MANYLVKFTVNGRRTEQVVAANSTSDAKKLIEAQYAGQKISFLSATRL